MDPVLELRQDRFEDSWQIAVHVDIQDPQHVKAAPLQHARAVCICGELTFSRVGCAVDLDDELRVEADEIDDILIDRPLPAEFPSGESAIAQRLPELRLGAGL